MAKRVNRRNLSRAGILAKVWARCASWRGPQFRIAPSALANVVPHPCAASHARFRSALVQPAPSPDETSVTLIDKLAIDEAAMSVGFCISSPSLDRHGDHVLPRGFESTRHYFDANPQVFFAHRSDGFPIARAKPRGAPREQPADVWVENDKLYSRAYFHGKTEESAHTFMLVAEGVLTSASIGFVPLKGRLRTGTFDEESAEAGNAFSFDMGGIIFEEWTLLEWSVVPVPANGEAIRSWLDPSRKLAPALRKSLSPYVLPRKTYPTSMKTKRLKGGSPLGPRDMGGDREDRKETPSDPLNADTQDTDVADVQCIEFDASLFADEQACKAWLEENGFEGVEMTPDHEGQASQSTRGADNGDENAEPHQKWMFCAFDAKECEPESHKAEEIEQGVVFHTCKRAKADEGEDEKEPTSGDSYDKADDDLGDGGSMATSAGADHDEPDDDDRGGKPDGDADDRKPRETLRPYGAEVLTCVAHHFEDVREYLEEAVQVLEHPQVLKYCEKLLALISKQVEDVKDFGTKTYPDHFNEPVEGGDATIDDDEGDDGERKPKPKPSKPKPKPEDDDEEPDADDEPDAGAEDDDGDEDDKPKKPKKPKKPGDKPKSVAGYRVYKSLTKKQQGTINEAAECFEELASEDNLKKNQRAVCRLHATALRGLATVDNEPVTNAVQTIDNAELELFARAMDQLEAELSLVKEKYYEQTGEDLFE